MLENVVVCVNQRTALYKKVLFFLFLFLYSVRRELALPKAQELHESRGGRPGLPVTTKPYGFCGRKAKFEVFPRQISSTTS